VLDVRFPAQRRSSHLFSRVYCLPRIGPRALWTFRCPSVGFRVRGYPSFDALAEHVVRDQINMDLDWRTPKGRRHHAALELQSAQTIRNAIKMNEVETHGVILRGILITVSTAKKAEVRTPDRRTLKVEVDEHLAVSLGPFFNQSVVIQGVETIKWSTDTGRETRSYQMMSIELAEPSTGTDSDRGE
jgi:hypothetical protein